MFCGFSKLTEISSASDSIIFVSDEQTDTKTNSHRIILMLDESGSMDSQRAGAIEAVNSFVVQQKKESHGDVCLFDLITFNNSHTSIITNTKIEDVNPITLEQYRPNGSTALYDSIWSVLTAHKNERDVILVVMTDGEDTISRHHTQSQIKENLSSFHRDRGWQIVWLGADATAESEGRNSGASSISRVDFSNLTAFCSTSLSAGVSAFRNGTSRKIDL